MVIPINSPAEGWTAKFSYGKGKKGKWTGIGDRVGAEEISTNKLNPWRKQRKDNILGWVLQGRELIGYMQRCVYEGYSL